MKFEEALYNFQRELAAEYGCGTEGLVKIGLEPDLYQAIMMEAYRKTPYSSSFNIVDAAEPKFMNVTVVPRERKKEF